MNVLITLLACAGATVDSKPAMTNSKPTAEPTQETPQDGRTVLAIQGYVEAVGGPIPSPELDVYVDHVLVGETVQGFLEVEAEPGAHYVRLLEPGYYAAHVDVVAVEGETVKVETGLTSGAMAERSWSEVPEMLDGWVLPANTTSFTWDIEDALGRPVALESNGTDTQGLGGFMSPKRPGGTRLNLAQPPPPEEPIVDIDDAGRLVVDEMSALNEWLSGRRSQEVIGLHLTGESGDLYYRFDTRFRVGHHTLTGTVAPPPSNPGLELEGMTVRVELSGEEPRGAFETTVSANGTFQFDHLPTGGWSVFGNLVDADGQPYRFRDSPRVKGDLHRSYQLLGRSDLDAGLPYRLD